MCFIIWLVEQVFIKLGWMKATDSRDNCGPAVPQERQRRRDAVTSTIAIDNFRQKEERRSL